MQVNFTISHARPASEAPAVRLPEDPVLHSKVEEALSFTWASTAADFEAVGRLRYVEMDMGIVSRSSCCDHDIGTLIEPSDRRSWVLLGRTAFGETIASMRVTPAEEWDGSIKWFTSSIPATQRANSVFTARLVIAARHRGTSVLKQCLIATYQSGLKLGIERNFHYCAERLEKFYERWGFVRFAANVTHPVEGEKVPMVLDLQNVGHLLEVRSPFAGHAKARQ